MNVLPLASFEFSIDNTTGTVTTASASSSGDILAPGATLFTVTFDVKATGMCQKSGEWIYVCHTPPERMAHCGEKMVHVERRA